ATAEHGAAAQTPVAPRELDRNFRLCLPGPLPGRRNVIMHLPRQPNFGTIGTSRQGSGRKGGMSLGDPGLATSLARIAHRATLEAVILLNKAEGCPATLPPPFPEPGSRLQQSPRRPPARTFPVAAGVGRLRRT